MQQTSQQQRQNPSQNDWDEWKESTVTQWFFKFLEEEAHTHRKYMGMGSCRKESVLDTGVEYTLASTRADIYELIGSIEYEDINPEEENSNENYSRGPQDSY